jgi:RecB family endonuclease NucS
VGRLTAHLPEATRLILFKADGSVSIHADDRAYKPLNWMSPPCFTTESNETDKKIITVENKSGERLVITVSKVIHNSTHDLGIDPGLVKDGVESHLQELLALHVETFGKDWQLVRRNTQHQLDQLICFVKTKLEKMLLWKLKDEAI